MPALPSSQHEAAQDAARRLPPHLAQSVWLGHSMGAGPTRVIASGHAKLDAELPGGGWPCQSLIEVLQEPAWPAEWRLLGPCLSDVVRRGGHVLLIGAPLVPHAPALWRQGLPPERLILVDARTAQERLWATEQALQAGCFIAVLSWLPQVQASALRRLQTAAARHPGLAFVFRPTQHLREASAAPLRVRVGLGPCPHPLVLHIVKRRGPSHAWPLTLPCWPPDLAALLPLAPTSPPLPPGSPPPSLSPSDHAELDRFAADMRPDMRRVREPAQHGLHTEPGH